MQTFETLMLRLTTNVTVSPASSARSSSAAWRMSSIASGRVSANSAVSSSGAQRARPSRPARSRRPTRSRADRRGASVRPEPRRGMKRQYFVLTTSSTPCVDPLGVDVAAGRRTAARSARRRPPPGACAPDAATGTGARARCGRRWRSGRRGRSRPRRRAPATSRRGSAGPGCRRRASAAAPRATSRFMSSIVDRRRPRPARADVGASRAGRCASSARPPRSRSRPAPRRSSGGAGRSSAG